jgi:hypothetical protein
MYEVALQIYALYITSKVLKTIPPTVLHNVLYLVTQSKLIKISSNTNDP